MKRHFTALISICLRFSSIKRVSQSFVRPNFNELSNVVVGAVLSARGFEPIAIFLACSAPNETAETTTQRVRAALSSIGDDL